MSKVKNDITSGLKDAIAYMRGDKSRGEQSIFTIPNIDVKSVREKTGLSQETFSYLFAIKIRTLQDWEQHRRQPGAPARILLALIDQHPTTVKKTLESLGHPIGKKMATSIQHKQRSKK